MSDNSLVDIKQVLQDKYFRWFDPIESEEVIQHSTIDGDGFGIGAGYGNFDGDGCGYIGAFGDETGYGAQNKV